jgi:hypothetical protein
MRFYLLNACEESILGAYERAFEAYLIAGEDANSYRLLEAATAPVLESVLPETLEAYECLLGGC